MLGQYIGAHRLSYLLNVGDLGPEEMCLHKCDNRKCVNPEHLFKGSAQDNTNDMISKGRAAWQSDPESHRERSRRGNKKPGPAILPGEDHSTAKLAENQVRAIKRSKAKGTDLAAMYGVSVSTISKIRNGHLWKHL